MTAKIILQIREEDLESLKKCSDKIINSEMVVIPSSIKILIKDKEGFWKEIKEDIDKLSGY